MPDNHDDDPDLQVVESIFEALERNDPEAALALAVAARQREGAEDPVIHFLGGIAMLELDDPEGAILELKAAVELDPEDPDFRANLAMACFRAGHVEDAAREARAALDADTTLPDANYAMALVVERAGTYEEADRLFACAQRLDPDAFPVPRRMSRSEFEAHVTAASERLPEDFRRHLDQVAIGVEDLPSDAILEDGTPLTPELLGLFVGVSLAEQSSLAPGGELPPRILLFQRNIERHFVEADQLEEEIARTLYHELGHYLGLDEAELEAIDLD